MKKNKATKPQESVASVLPWLAKNQGWEKQLDQHSIFVNWQTIFEEDVLQHAEPLKIERGVLWLEVDNSAWLQHFQMMKEELLEAVNRSLRLSALKDIKLLLAKNEHDKKTKENKSSIQFKRPSGEKVAAFQSQVMCIADEKCREALMQLWYLAEACKMKKNEF